MVIPKWPSKSEICNISGSRALITSENNRRAPDWEIILRTKAIMGKTSEFNIIIF